MAAMAAASLAPTAAALRGTAQQSFDLLIRNGLVIDGTGLAMTRADVAVRGGKIAGVGRYQSATATVVIDAAGLMVAPGFIDVHTHADDLAAHPLAENFVRMGVTTIIAGNCGSSAVRIGEALDAISQTGASVNFATLIGHNSVRREVMGTQRRAPTMDELIRMKSLIWRAMADGAVGFSTGLQYVPGTYADTTEIVTLAKVAGAEGGVYASHMRNEGTEIEKAIEETIRVGEMASCPVEISHLKIDSPNRWGTSRKALAMIDAARERGVEVRADQYVYTAASSGLGIRLPAWALEGGQSSVTERLSSDATWDKIRTEMKALLAERGLLDYAFAVVASYRQNPAYNGRSIAELAAKVRGDGSLNGQLELIRDMMLAGGASMVYHFMSEDDLAAIARHPHVSFASDASVLTPGEGVPHPRGYGNNARVLGRYVREQRLLSLVDAVRKMTTLPAAHFRLPQRGSLKEGFAADIVVFDASRVGDAAVYDRPHQYPTGIPHVFVNGVAVVRNGAHTGARAGQVIRGAGGTKPRP